MAIFGLNYIITNWFPLPRFDPRHVVDNIRSRIEQSNFLKTKSAREIDFCGTRKFPVSPSMPTYLILEIYL